MIRATTYWNKVIKDSSAPFGTKVIPDEYEIKDQQNIDNTLEDLKKRWKGHKRMTINQNSIIEDLGRYYGIHSYRVITSA